MQSANTPLIGGTPTRAQIYSQQPRIQQNPQATALLTSPSSDSDDSEEEVQLRNRPNRNYNAQDYKDDEDEEDEDEGLTMRLS